jgi:phosphoribosylglycinamide formyltransferase-1
MAALIAAAKAPDYPADVVLVVADRIDAAGLPAAQAAGVATAIADYRALGGKSAGEREIDRVLAEARIDLVCLAGFMRVLSADFVEHWRDRLINIHPSLLPAFPGLDTHARALAAKVREHGCTVHFVRAAVDSGPIIARAIVPVIAGDTAEALAARVLEAEHRLYPKALALVASRAVAVEGERVVRRKGIGARG